MTFRLRSPVVQLDTGVRDDKGIQPTALPPGVILSPQSGHPVTSWGLRPLDDALNGGLPLSSLTLVIEDLPTAYHVPLLSYVTAQGIAHGHAVALACFSRSAESVLENIPCQSTAALSSQPRIPSPVQEMNIAWRYQKPTQSSAAKTGNKLSSSLHQSFTHDFDLSQSPSAFPAHSPISCIPIDPLSSDPLAALLADISRHITNANKRKLLSRIIVHSLPIDQPSNNLIRFLTRLRVLARLHAAVVVVSCDRDAVHSVGRCAVADAVLLVDSFDGLGAKVAGLGSEWLGAVIVKKSFRFGKGPPFPGRGDVWVFKRGRRKYTMERATCAPDEDIEAEQDGNEKPTESTFSQVVCGADSSNKSNYEF